MLAFIVHPFKKVDIDEIETALRDIYSSYGDFERVIDETAEGYLKRKSHQLIAAGADRGSAGYNKIMMAESEKVNKRGTAYRVVAFGGNYATIGDAEIQVTLRDKDGDSYADEVLLARLMQVGRIEILSK